MVLSAKGGAVGMPLLPQREEGEVVHETCEEAAGFPRFRLPYVCDVFRGYAALEELVAYLVASRTVGKTDGKDVYKRQGRGSERTVCCQSRPILCETHHPS